LKILSVQHPNGVFYTITFTWLAPFYPKCYNDTVLRMAIPNCSVELLLDCKAQIGEAPFYDSSTHQLLWVDIRGQTINHLDVETGQNKAVKLHDTVGAAIPVEGSETELVALVGKDICLVNRETG